MREILFRGKCVDTGTWYEGGYIHLHKTTHCPIGNPERFPDNDIHQIVFERMTDWELPNQHLRVDVKPETIGQFTGLTDKNGKKIFEGDIVKCRHRVVKFYLDDIEKINPRRSYGKEIEETDSYGFSCFYWRNYAVSFRDGCIRIQNGSDHHDIRANYIYNHKIEVIGNIHDNPELLEVEDGN